MQKISLLAACPTLATLPLWKATLTDADRQPRMRRHPTAPVLGCPNPGTGPAPVPDQKPGKGPAKDGGRF